MHHTPGFQSRVSVYLPCVLPLCGGDKVIKGPLHSAAAGERALSSLELGQQLRTCSGYSLCLVWAAVWNTEKAA